MPAALPGKIARYEIRAVLGRGMMGVVYEAFDPDLDRTIALKTIQLAFAATDEERDVFEKRFFAEARAAARLSHSGIVVVHDVGRDSDTGTLYIALERLQGRTLADVIRKDAPLPWREALRLVKAVAEALHHAHAQGVVHRDIKPANIMVLSGGEVKIMDFGIAKIDAAQLTAAGQVFGTPLYMSPEQALGRAVDRRADLFSLGVIGYGLLTGHAAFAAPTIPSIVTRVVTEDPAPPSQVVAGLPPEIDGVLGRALAKSPDDRYPDGRAMAEDLEDLIAGRPPRHLSRREAPRAVGTEWALELEEGQAPEPVVSLPPDDGSSAPIAGSLTGFSLPGREEVGGRGRVLPAVVATALVSLALAGWALRFGIAARPAVPARAPSATNADAADDGRSVAAESGAPGRLAIDFEHGLRRGTLKVWIDEELVLEEELDSRVTRKVLGLRTRKGSVEETVEVGPGKHEIKVQVAWDGNVKTERAWGTFTPGATRRLSARVGGVFGLRRDLFLDWD